MSLKENIKILSEANGVSGFEKGIANYLVKILKKKLGDAHVDNMGNVIACKKSPVGCGSVMLEAHLDEIGLMISKIDKSGFLRFVPVGGIDLRILPGMTVNIHSNGRNFKGVIGSKPPHIMSASEYDEVIGIDNLFIDAGFTEEEAKENITIGATATFDSSPVSLQGEFMSGKCMDDRASVAVLLDVVDKLSAHELAFDLYIAICVQEEVGLRGAAVASYSVNPDFAIAIDVTHAATPDESSCDIKCGCGPVICLGPNLQPQLVSSFINHLEKENIPYETEVEGGYTGTDAWAIQTSREGIPVMLLSLPLKYMHTPVETLSIEDCKTLSLSITSYLKSFKRTEEVLCF